MLINLPLMGGIRYGHYLIFALSHGNPFLVADGNSMLDRNLNLAGGNTFYFRGERFVEDRLGEGGEGGVSISSHATLYTYMCTFNPYLFRLAT